jgi:hypothetical protein
MNLRMICLFVGLCCVVLVRGQTQRPHNLPNFDQKTFHFGYGVGINSMDFFMTPKDSAVLEIRRMPGFGVNLLATARLAKYLDLRFQPGLQFGQRNLNISDTVGSSATGSSWKTQFESVYIELPLLIRYKAKRLNNYAPYVLIGVSPRWDIYGGEIENWKVVQRLIEPFDLFAELGTGIDLYLSLVKLSVELKYSVGFMNVFKPALELEDYFVFGNSIDIMRSGMTLLSFQIEGR